MSLKIALDLAAGGHVGVELRPPGPAPSCYFIFMHGAGGQWIWPLVQKVLYTAGQPICDYVALLRKSKIRERDVTGTSLQELLRSEGYAFGIIWDPASLPAELDKMGRKTFVFVRDPREVAAELLAAADGVPVPEFMQSQPVAALARRCRRLADFCRDRQHVKVVRLEDLTDGWARLVREIVETLGLQIPPEAAIRIEGSTPVVPHSAVEVSYQNSFNRASRALLDTTFSDSLATFGYLPEDTPSPAFLGRWGDFQRALSDRLSAQHSRFRRTAGAPPNSTGRASGKSTATVAPQERTPTSGLPAAELDPELCWRPRRNRKVNRTVLGRRITEESDDYGCRPVLGQPPAGEKTLAAYGCSFTYGSALSAEETFCSILQSMLPRWRVENYGARGYGTAQNLIQLRRNSRWSTPEYVTFCFYPDHRLRNVADISYRRMLMAFVPSSTSQQLYPRAALAGDGSLVFRYVKHPRWDLDGMDLSDFQNDEYYLDLIAAAIFESANEIVTQSNGHFFVTTLRGELSASLRSRLDDAGIPVVNASRDGREYTCLPDDPHPNALANQFFAERIRDYLIAQGANSSVAAASATQPMSA